MTDPRQQAIEALEGAAQFIENGVDCGYVRLPEDRLDPANSRLANIRAALSALRAAPAPAANTVTCTTCDGSGETYDRFERADGSAGKRLAYCPDCGGARKFIVKPSAPAAEGMAEALEQAIRIVGDHVETEALGRDASDEGWPLRDEYLHRWRAALAALPSGDARTYEDGLEAAAKVAMDIADRQPAGKRTNYEQGKLSAAQKIERKIRSLKGGA